MDLSAPDPGHIERLGEELAAASRELSHPIDRYTQRYTQRCGSTGAAYGSVREGRAAAEQDDRIAREMVARLEELKAHLDAQVRKLRDTAADYRRAERADAAEATRLGDG